MATAVTEPGESSGPKRRRRRARREVAAAAAASSAENGHNGQTTPVAVLVEPVPAIEAPAPPPDQDEFQDLLGQAVGLRLDAVSREFGGRDEMHVAALRNVTLDIGPCEFVAIIGPSGCGKSTLLSLMGGLDRPSSGHVYGAGLPLGELPDRDLSDYRLQRVSTIFQTFNLIPSMTVEDNVALPLTLAGVELEDRRKRARHLLALVGLEKRARARAGRLSGGEQQKVAVARALANRPGLILADEPTGSLDSAAGEVVLDLLQDLNLNFSSVSAIFSTSLVMGVVLLSTLYPARKASEVATPAIERSWRTPDPVGDHWEIPLPFAVTGDQATGLNGFLAEWFKAYEEYSIGDFVTQNVETSEHEWKSGQMEEWTHREEEGDGAAAPPKAYRIQLMAWLAPFDLGVSQQVVLDTRPTEMEDVFELQLTIHRQSGDISNWKRVNRRFLNTLRKQFLIWRTLGTEERERYLTEAEEVAATASSA